MSDEPILLDPIIIAPPVTNPGFAADHGLPADTLFDAYPGGSGYVGYGPAGSETLDNEVFDERLVGKGEGASNATLEERLKKKEDSEKKKSPPPTSPNPHPPEFIVDDGAAIAISTAPDVCRVGSTPTPFMSYALGSDDENYSPSVFSNGFAIKHNQSRIWYTRGDEPGTGLGVKSNTVSSKVIPNSHSGLVKVNGIWVQRHSDTCWLNNGNNPGEYTHVKSTETHEAPDANDEQDKRAWYEKAYDWTGDKLGQANDAVWEFDRNNYNVVTRGLGGLQAVGGAAEAVAGAGLAGVGGAASTTGVGGGPRRPGDDWRRCSRRERLRQFSSWLAAVVERSIHANDHRADLRPGGDRVWCVPGNGSNRRKRRGGYARCRGWRRHDCRDHAQWRKGRDRNRSSGS
ncbi:DUF4150 domain-containing protein [Bosea vestrisii]|uniref:DUF4150 domain-containing protein n=1 Tax=Bosea vestrisii TaxID=151416 RepID=UPI0024DF4E82|nr:DUF4150 domain-containing protein [Bosea vestrisii]WID96226.1 DUF4150 domain-containing protein [Bosea vestrisii]